MNDQTDAQLLRAYAEHRSEPAFAVLVRRHVDLVFSAAQRMVCDAHLAEDVAQGVFVALAKNAGQLTARPVLSGWLHRTAQNIAAQTVRTETRRRVREQESAAMSELLAAEPATHWQDIAPHLDAALGALSEPDRDAVLLRFFERKSAREIAQTLGISDEAAQKRVNRAVERLREGFAQLGVTVGAAGFVGLISANAVQAAPAGLAVTLSAAALAGTAATTSTIISATAKTFAMTTFQKTLITATVAVLAGAGIYETRQAAQLRDQVQTLQQQQTPLAEQIQQLQKDNSDLAGRLVNVADELAKRNGNSNELLKLRGEVSKLKAASLQQESTPAKAALNDWLARVETLKNYLEQNLRWKIPELVYSTEDDWLGAAQLPFESGNDCRHRLALVRSIACSRVASKLNKALEKYLEVNNGRFPANLTELSGYLETTVDSSILSRWAIQQASDFDVPASKLKAFGVTQKYSSLITLAESADPDFDERWLVGVNGYGAIPFKSKEMVLEETVDVVLKAYSAANGGRPPENLADTLPYPKAGGLCQE